MRNLRLCMLTVCMSVGASSLLADGNSNDPPQYQVKKTGSPPVIDGIVGPGEWDAADAAAGAWVDLNTHQADSHNLRFRMLWDAENLYILGETDYNGFAASLDRFENPDFGGLSYTANLYFDPNSDNEDLDAVPPGAPDGYQLAFGMDEGVASRRPTPSNPDQALRDPLDDNGTFTVDYIHGMLLEAHVNTPFGNQGAWDLSNDGFNGNYRDDLHPGIVYELRADNDDLNGTGQPGGLWEMAIAWSEFDATDPDNPNYVGTENGLFHVDAPVDGETWGFEMGVITPDFDNFLPSWSEPRDGDPNRSAFATWPNGRITFVEEEVGDPLDLNGDGVVDVNDAYLVPTGQGQQGLLSEILAAANLLPGDFDGLGGVAFPDFLTLSTNFGQNVDSYALGDADVNGNVAFPDFLALSTNFGKSVGAAAAVPEPSSLALLGLGGLALTLVRRRRS